MGDARIPSDWEGEYCKFAVCWPNSPQWLAVLRGALTIPAEGRFWNEQTGTIIEAQQVIQETFDYNFRNEEVIMACGDTGLTEIANSLTLIAGALGNQGGVGGGGCNNYCYSSENVNVNSYITLPSGENWPIMGTVPTPILPETGYPEGYPDQETYDADRCAKANKITNDLIASLTNVGQTNWGVGVIGAVVITACLVGLVTVPPAAIPLLLFALTGTLGIATACTGMANYISEHRGDVVCILYTEGSIELITSLLSDFLDAAVLAIPVEGAVAIAIKQIVLFLMNSNVLGYLFTSQAKGLYPDADCSGCVDCGQTWAWESGEDQLAWEIADESNVSTVVISAIDPPCISVRATVTGSPGIFDWKTTEFDGPMLINPTSTLNSHSYLGSATTFYQYIRLAGSEGTKRYLSGSGTAIGDTPLDNDLSSWVGETIVEIGFECAWSVTGDHDLTFYNVIWTCGEEE